MNKNDLVSKVSDETGLSKTDSAKAVDSVIETITSELKSGGDVRLVGFEPFLLLREKLQPEETHKLGQKSKFQPLTFQNLEQVRV